MYRDERVRSTGPRNYLFGIFRGYKKGNILAEILKVACGSPQSRDKQFE